LSKSDPLLQKAERYIRSAQLLAVDGDFDSAASRLYYAMFYIAEALLEAKGLTFSSHKAVISAFGQEFVKTQILDARFHQSLLGAFSQRQLGDYSTEAGITRDDIAVLIHSAREFLETARAWLTNNSTE
jgi:uncharacterized protein (UPF0332 family)